MLVSSSNKPSSSSSESSSESAKNEGFLGSVWHKLTGHPKDETSESNTSSIDTSPKDQKKDGKSKDDNETKKDSGTGS
jgi:molecular chaperone DnaJ